MDYKGIGIDIWDVVYLVGLARSGKPKTLIYWVASKSIAEGCARIASRCADDVNGSTRWTVTLRNWSKLRFRAL
jgi:hypothetical protein